MEFVWIFYTETEDVGVRFYGVVNAHIASEMIKTQSSYFCISKNKEKQQQKRGIKKNNNNNRPPGVDLGTLERQMCSIPLSYVNITAVPNEKK